MHTHSLKKALLVLGLAVTAGVLTIGVNAALGSSPTQNPVDSRTVSPTFTGVTVTGTSNLKGNTTIGTTGGSNISTINGNTTVNGDTYISGSTSIGKTSAPDAGISLEVVGGKVQVTGDEFRSLTNGVDVVVGGTSFSPGQGAVGTVSNHPFDIYANSARAVRILQNGNVGIGTETTVPAEKLQVNGNTILNGFAKLYAAAEPTKFLQVSSPSGTTPAKIETTGADLTVNSADTLTLLDAGTNKNLNVGGVATYVNGIMRGTQTFVGSDNVIGNPSFFQVQMPEGNVLGRVFSALWTADSYVHQFVNGVINQYATGNINIVSRSDINIGSDLPVMSYGAVNPSVTNTKNVNVRAINFIDQRAPYLLQLAKDGYIALYSQSTSPTKSGGQMYLASDKDMDINSYGNIEMQTADPNAETGEPVGQIKMGKPESTGGAQLNLKAVPAAGGKAATYKGLIVNFPSTETSAIIMKASMSLFQSDILAGITSPQTVINSNDNPLALQWGLAADQPVAIGSSLQVTGKVGIGTATPLSSLDVANGLIKNGRYSSISSFRGAANSYTNLFLGGAIDYNGNATYTVRGDGGSNYAAAIKMDNLGGNAGAIRFITRSNTGGADANLTEPELNNLTRMSIVGSNVGIGTESPAYKLDVAGNIRVNSTVYTSDARLKDVIGKYGYGLKEIMKLNAVKFNYKKDNPLGLPSDKERAGVIAQELKKIFPNAVEQGTDGYFTVNNDPIFWAVINAIQELKKEKDAEIEALKAENAEIKAALCEVKADLKICKK